MLKRNLYRLLKALSDYIYTTSDVQRGRINNINRSNIDVGDRLLGI